MKEWTIADNTTAAVLNLLMMQTWFSNLQFSFNGVSWFVADLMLCYLITPLLSWWIRQRETSADASVLRSYLVPFVVLFCIRALLQMGQYKGVINISNHSFPLSRMLEYGMAFVAGTAILARGGISMGRHQYGDALRPILAWRWYRSPSIPVHCLP